MLKILILSVFVVSIFSAVSLPLNSRALDSNLASVAIQNTFAGGLNYYGEIQIGTPPQSFNVSFNTDFPYLQINSINTTATCAISSCYDGSASSTAQDELIQVDFSYYNATQTGQLYEDTISFGGVEVENAEFVVTLASYNNDKSLSGVFGLGLPTSTQPGISSVFETYAEQQGSPKVFSLYLTADVNQTGSSLTLGGFDSSLIDSDEEFIYYNSSNTTWQIEVSDFGLGTQSYLDGKTGIQAIFSSGSSRIYGNGVFTELAQQLNYSVPCENMTDLDNKYPSFYVKFGDYSYEIKPSVYYTELAGTGTCNPSIIEVGDLSEIQPGTIVLGLPFFQSHYISFNMDDKTIGIATPLQPTPTINAWANSSTNPYTDT